MTTGSAASSPATGVAPMGGLVFAGLVATFCGAKVLSVRRLVRPRRLSRSVVQQER